MHAYRFRIQTEENEDFLMDIEVKASQNFFDFHHAIKEFCNITSNELASFYICDDSWRKKTEIMLLDMSDDIDKENPKPVLLMEKAKLNEVINNPHQKFLYVYDFLKMHTFFIELMQIREASASLEYPALIRKEGEINLNKSSDLLGFIDDEEILLPDDKIEDVDSLFGEHTDDEDMDNLGTDVFFGENDKL
jgi:hypothetical protein